MNIKIRILGIDPKPSGKSHQVFASDQNGDFSRQLPEDLALQGLNGSGKLDHEGLGKLLERIEESKDRWLICWDAPLVESETFEIQSSSTMREIERRARKWNGVQNKLKRHRGLSTQGFSGCSHWVVSQRLLGIPSIHSGHKIRKNFRLLQDMSHFHDWSQNPSRKVAVAEVHPALSLAAWCDLKDVALPPYKTQNFGSAVETLANELPELKELGELSELNDDIVDAFVAWKMGRDLIKGDSEIFGDASTGSFLLPKNVPTKLRETLCDSVQ